MSDWVICFAAIKIKGFAFAVALAFPILVLWLLIRRPDAKSWQHYALLLTTAVYCSILCLGASGYLTSFGYGDAKVQFIDDKVAEAKEILAQIEELKADVDLTLEVVSAANGNRWAFDRLNVLANQSTDPRAKRAAAELKNIVSSQLLSPLGALEVLSVTRNTNINTISFEEAERSYDNVDAIERFRLIMLIGGNVVAERGITPEKSGAFLIKVMKSDANLQNLRYAQYLFRMRANDPELDKGPYFSIDSYVDWWGKNKGRFK